MIIRTRKGASNRSSRFQLDENGILKPVRFFVRNITPLFFLLIAGYGIFLGVKYIGSQKLEAIEIYGIQPVVGENISLLAGGLNKKDLEQLLVDYQSERYWSLELGEIRNKVEAHQWVSSASVRRQWPNSLVVTIDENVPVARLNEYQLLTESGEIIDLLETEAFSSLPMFRNKLLKVSETKKLLEWVEIFNRLQKLLKSHQLKITEIGTTTGQDIWLTLQNKVRIELGTENIEDRLVLLIEQIDNGLIEDWQQMAVADLRYNSGFAISWRDQGLLEDSTKKIAIDAVHHQGVTENVSPFEFNAENR